MPSIPETIAILPGELVICLEVAAGIINIEVINKIPTIFTQVATNITKRIKNYD